MIPAGSKKSWPKAFGPFRVAEPLGQEGGVLTFRGVHSETGQEALLYVTEPISTIDPEASRKLMENAQAARKIVHPAIIRIMDLGIAGERVFVAYEPVEGVTLRDVMDRYKSEGQTIPPVMAAAIMVELAWALDSAHVPRDDPKGSPIIHRNINPEQVAVDQNGRIRLFGLGLPKSYMHQLRTKGSTLLTKMAYMAPEQVEGRRVTAATDLFSLGVVFYELLTGINPFTAESRSATVNAIRSRSVSIPSTISPWVPRAFDEIACKLLERSAARRLGSAQELARSLTVYLKTEGSGFKLDDALMSALGWKAQTGSPAPEESPEPAPSLPMEDPQSRTMTAAPSAYMIGEPTRTAVRFSPPGSATGQTDETEPADRRAFSTYLARWTWELIMAGLLLLLLGVAISRHSCNGSSKGTAPRGKTDSYVPLYPGKPSRIHDLLYVRAKQKQVKAPAHGRPALYLWVDVTNEGEKPLFIGCLDWILEAKGRRMKPLFCQGVRTEPLHPGRTKRVLVAFPCRSEEQDVWSLLIPSRTRR